MEYTVVVENGNKLWYFNGERHREDGPAIEYANGGKSWYRNGELHREDGPAIEYTNGDKYWYRNGELYREDGPAIEYANGEKEWYINGKRQKKELSQVVVAVKSECEACKHMNSPYDNVDEFIIPFTDILNVGCPICSECGEDLVVTAVYV
jgi:hypothetical protein